MVLGEVDRWLDESSSTPRPGASLLLLVVAAGLILAVIGGFLAWQGYEERADRIQERIAETASQTARVAGQYFDDRIAVLEAIAGMPSLQGRDPSVMVPVLEAISDDAMGFRGGAGWVDADGILQVATGPAAGQVPLDLSERIYVDRVLETASPYISQTYPGMVSGELLLVMAVPTFTQGAVSGMLVASVLVEDLLSEIPALSPPRVQMRVVDRAEEVILENGRAVAPQPPTNIALLDPNVPSSLVGTGLNGEPDQFIGIGRVERLGWVIVAEQDRAMALAGARTRLFAEIGIVVALLLLTAGAALVAAQRLNASHGQLIRRARDLGTLEHLGSRMAGASDPREVALTALDVFAEVFASPRVAIGLVETRGMRVFEAESESGISETSITLATPSVLVDAFNSGKTMVLDSREYRKAYPPGPETPELSSASSGILSGRFTGRVARGAISVVIDDFPPSAEDIALFEAMALLLPGSLGRAVAIERERMASRVFQQALLPRDNIGLDVTLQRAVRYLPAVGEVEVGGDWYDLWTIGGDNIGVVVGDVVGRGVEAAAAMGQLRSALRATVVAANSTGEALAHLDDLTGQIAGTPSATVLLGNLELSSGVVTMASAGHLPPLIAARDGVRVMYEVRGTPIGFLAQPTQRSSVAIRLRPEETLVMYTDGLVERRDETIDHGIARLADALRENSQLPLERLADALVEACIDPANSDDVALICVRLVGDVSEHFTCVADLGDFGEVAKVLRKWLKAHGYPKRTVEAVLNRVSEAVSVIQEVTDPDDPGEVMIEVDRSDGLAVTVEHRRRSLSGEPASDSFILRQWQGGEPGPRGPRLRFAMSPDGSANH